jgi:hypothetical protein
VPSCLAGAIPSCAGTALGRSWLSPSSRQSLGGKQWKAGARAGSLDSGLAVSKRQIQTVVLS